MPNSSAQDHNRRQEHTRGTTSTTTEGDDSTEGDGEVPVTPREVVCYISIDNKNKRLSGIEWLNFMHELRNVCHALHNTLCEDYNNTLDGRYLQVLKIHEDQLPALRMGLSTLCYDFRQDSITLAIVPDVEFIEAPEGWLDSGE